MYLGNILDNPPIIIPTNEEEMARILIDNGFDWTESLNFLADVAKKQGIEINKQKVADLVIKELFADE